MPQSFNRYTCRHSRVLIKREKKKLLCLIITNLYMKKYTDTYVFCKIPDRKSKPSQLYNAFLFVKKILNSSGKILTFTIPFCFKKRQLQFIPIYKLNNLFIINEINRPSYYNAAVMKALFLVKLHYLISFKQIHFLFPLFYSQERYTGIKE